MKSEDWHQVLATRPATPNQRGAIMGHFERLGLHPRRDRAERLAVCAALLGIRELGSTSDLSMGQAGRLISTLRHLRDRADLPAPAALPAHAAETAGGDQGSGTDGVVTLADALRRLGVFIAAALHQRQDAGDP